MQNITNISLNKIIENIKNDNYFIPKFRRNFEWKSQDVIALGDSIIRKYPISSLLTILANDTLKIASFNLVKKEFNNDTNIKLIENKYIILDGHQRIIAIAKLFSSYDQNNEYYFDLLSILVENFIDDDICAKKCIKDNFLNLPINIKNFCKVFTKVENEQPTRQNNRFISGKSIINGKSTSIITDFVRSFENDFKESDLSKYLNFLAKTINSINSYSIPIIKISSDTNLKNVIKITERIICKKLTFKE